jgi:hypothetical protein
VQLALRSDGSDGRPRVGLAPISLLALQSPPTTDARRTNAKSCRASRWRAPAAMAARTRSRRSTDNAFYMPAGLHAPADSVNHISNSLGTPKIQSNGLLLSSIKSRNSPLFRSGSQSLATFGGYSAIRTSFIAPNVRPPLTCSAGGDRRR